MLRIRRKIGEFVAAYCTIPQSLRDGSLYTRDPLVRVPPQAEPSFVSAVNDHFQQAHFQSHIPMKRGFYVQNTCHTDKGYDPGQSPGSDSGKRSSRRSPGHNWKNAGRDYAAGAFFVEGKGLRIISELPPWGVRCFFWRWCGLRGGFLPQPAGSAWSGWVRSAHRPTR